MWFATTIQLKCSIFAGKFYHEPISLESEVENWLNALVQAHGFIYMYVYTRIHIQWTSLGRYSPRFVYSLTEAVVCTANGNVVYTIPCTELQD